MSDQQQQTPQSNPPSPRQRAARKNLEKAWQASRSRWEFTPARRSASRRALENAHKANRTPGRRFSPAQREAVRRNVARAREALKARGRSPEHLAKLRESIAKARAARTDQSFVRQAQKVLSHGLFARRLRGPVGSLGENPRDYQKIHRLVARYLCPQTEEEEKAAHLIADSLWRQHRLFFARAVWQLKRLDFFLSKAPPLETPDPNETRLRAHTLITILLDDDDPQQRALHLIGTTERLLRRFLRLRFGGDPNFHTNVHASSFSLRLSRAERDELADDLDCSSDTGGESDVGDEMDLLDPFDEKSL